MSPRARWLRACSALALLVASCASEPREPQPGSLAAPIVYGDDDRREWFELDNAALQARVAASVVALLPRSELSLTSKRVSIDASSWAELAGLCPSERFAAQPAAALCTGVLVDWDLILTASHCARVIALEDLAVVFGYYYRAQSQLAVEPRDVYGARSIVAEALSAPTAEPRLDYVFIKLDRPVAAPHAPSPLRLRALSQGQALAMVGASGGVPCKVDTAGTVRDPRASAADYFVADTDSARGASGGPAFDSDLALTGILARGGPDLFETDDGCFATLVRDDTSEPEEQFSYARHALIDLCRAHPEASSLCRRDCAEPCAALPRPKDRDVAACTVTRLGSRASSSMPAAWLALALSLLCRRCRSRKQSLLSSAAHEPSCDAHRA